MMDWLNSLVGDVNSVLWGVFCLIPLLCGTGIFYTIRLRFVQVRKFGLALKILFGGASLFGKRADKTGMSSFQALATAIAAQVGTGNVAGTATAIVSGGPGALFWLWVAAFFGMATIFAEAVLAQTYRDKDANGHIVGGPAYYISKGLGSKKLAVFFSISIIIALGFIGNMVQSNSIGQTCSTAFGIPAWVIGIVVAILAAIIFLGGVNRVAAVTEKLVPIMAVLYLVGGLILLILRLPYLPETIGMIFKYAFFPNAIIGGGLGYALKTAISQGVKRGLFSNEAGMGSTPHAHAMAKVKHPHDQGVVAMVGVFIDTFVVLTMTALVVISTLYAGNGPLAHGAVEGINKADMAQLAFSSVFGSTGGSVFVAICLFFFAFSTILSWNFFGKLNVQYLFGKKATVVYSVLGVVFIFLGSCLSNDLVWELSDLFNQLMVIPNALAVLALSALVVRAAKGSK